MNRSIFIVAGLLLLMAAGSVLAESKEAQHQNVERDRIAIQGYDPVSYFEAGTARKGNEKFTFEHNGAVYRFESETHQKAFAADPAKYAPQYGGWCATAMAEGKKVEIDPKSFKITNGRLFLFYNGLFADARKKWLKDEANLTVKADASWKQTIER
jgi:hypothetical protein